MKLPQPDEQASLSMMWSMTPSLHAQALHVLAADVQDELHAGQHLLGAAQMGHGFVLSRVHAQGLKQQSLAVAGHRGVPDAHERLSGFESAGSAAYSWATAAFAQASASPLFEA